MDSDKAYIKDNLYLPKSKIRSIGVINSLTFKVRNTKEPLRVWDETDTHLIVPRHYIKQDKYSSYPFPFIDLRPTDFPPVHFESDIQWRNQGQELAFSSMLSNDNGILNLNTGKGKTVIALQRIVTKGVPALIVVHNSYLKQQWIERINQLIRFDGEIGTIESNKMNWKQPITIAMILTLANRAKEGTLPEGLQDWFGMAVYDEVHHLSAPVFSKSANICLGQRYGLSATPRRADGLDCIIKYHLGDVFFEDMSYDLIPEIFFLETNVQITQKPWDNIWSLITRVSENQYAIGTRYQLLKQLYEEGRKVIAISSRLELMNVLAERFPSKDVCTINEKTPVKDRTKLVKSSRLILAIGKLGLEGLDDDDIDTLVFLTPVGGDDTVTESGREYLGSQVKQGFGRILRSNGKLKKPKVFFFDDINIESLTALTYQVQIFLKRNGFDYTIEKFSNNFHLIH